jgi:hypothetical protein
VRAALAWLYTVEDGIVNFSRWARCCICECVNENALFGFSVIVVFNSSSEPRHTQRNNIFHTNSRNKKQNVLQPPVCLLPRKPSTLLRRAATTVAAACPLVQDSLLPRRGYDGDHCGHWRGHGDWGCNDPLVTQWLELSQKTDPVRAVGRHAAKT